MQKSQSISKDQTSTVNPSVLSSLKINPEVKFNMPYSKKNNDSIPKKYQCTCCGESWDMQKTHFAQTASPLYQSNNGYITVCSHCMDEYYTKLVELYDGNEAFAAQHLCRLFDIIYIDDVFAKAKPTTVNRSRWTNYLSLRNLKQVKQLGKTYTDGIKNEFVDGVRIDQEADANLPDNPVSAASLKRWGTGLPTGDYKLLDEHYNMLKKNNPNCDSNQEIFIKSLCNLNVLMIKAMKKGDSDKYVKLTDQYAKTFKQAGLQAFEEQDASNEDTFGVTLSLISQYTPEEFYKDKTLYSDYDQLGEYIDRHITRPLRNILTGSDTQDEEFFVPEDLDGDEYDE